MQKKNKPKPPKPPKGYRPKISIIDKKVKINTKNKIKQFFLKYKIKYNDFMNKYYYSFLDRFYPRFFNWLNRMLFIEIPNYIRMGVWGIIILFLLRLFGYNLTWMNYFSSLAIYISLYPFTKFIYKIMRIED